MSASLRGISMNNSATQNDVSTQIAGTMRRSGTKARKSLTHVLILVLGILIALLNGIQIWLISSAVRNGIRKDNEDGALEMAEGYALASSNAIHEYVEHLQMYITEDVSFGGNETDIAGWLQTHSRVRNVDFIHVLFCGPDGTGYADTGDRIDMRDSDCYKAMFEANAGSFVGEPFLTQDAAPRPVFYVAKPLVRDGKTIGFFAGLASLDEFQADMDKIKLWGTGYAWILSGKGVVIAHPKREYELKKSLTGDLYPGNKEVADVSARMIKGEKGSEWVSGLDSRGRNLVAFSPIKGSPWSFAFTVSDVEVYRLSTQLTAQMSGMALFIIVVLLLTSGLLLRRSIKPLQVVQKSIGEIASGNADLTRRINVKTEDEIGGIVDGFNGFTEKLQSIMKELKQSKDLLVDAGEELQGSAQNTAASITEILANIQSMSGHIANQSASVEETAGAVNEIASNIGSLEKMIETQSAGVTEASAAVEEMIGNINSVDASVEKLASAFETLQKRAQEGSDKQNDVNERIRQIENQSAMLEEANSAIANIASQTNLLAMNAAIEAAHAGEAGKGFSVVADEIRKLSETSTVQSKTIGNELTKIEETISNIVNASTQSSLVFNEVAAGIKSTDELVRQIKGAMMEQNEGSKQISQALSSMNNSTAEVRTASAEMSAGNKAILDEVKSLQDATGSMKDSMNEMGIGARKINETGTELREIADKINASIGHIGNQVDRFKV